MEAWRRGFLDLELAMADQNLRIEESMTSHDNKVYRRQDGALGRQRGVKGEKEAAAGERMK